MQLSNVEALSSISAQQLQAQKAKTTEQVYQVKVDGENKGAVVEKDSEGYYAYVPGVAGMSVHGVSEMAAEIDLAARAVDLQA
jgi:hypothetical protein